MSTDTKDVMENNTVSFNEQVLAVLLIDRSTKKNIVWATDDYIDFGVGYSPESELTIDKISGLHSFIITPRIFKEKQKQRNCAEIIQSFYNKKQCFLQCFNENNVLIISAVNLTFIFLATFL